MGVWATWLRRPHSTLLRRVSFQLHLWIGLATGLYVVMLSVTGSALVFRRELDRAFSPRRPAFNEALQVLPQGDLAEAARRAYPGYAVARVGDVERRSPVVRITLARGSDRIERLFNAYTGEDLGAPYPWRARALLWVADLHDELLMIEGGRGRFWNGVGSILVTLLCATGAVIWWRGVFGWRRAITVDWRAAWPRLNFDLHSATGFWLFGMMALWAVSGIYIAFPAPFGSFVDWVWGDLSNYPRPGDIVLEWLVRLHFGRWRSHTLKAVWVVIGLVPAVMFVTGLAMWWCRVVRGPAKAGHDVRERAVVQDRA